MKVIDEKNINQKDAKIPLEDSMESLTPRVIVQRLDKYIVGQKDAKRKVAIALRNRFRRSKLSQEMKEEIIPKNILMIGPTGVGKTEIARRLARLTKAPFIKVEATKFTEVGYVGRDVESMVRDLMELGVRIVEKEKFEEIQEKAKELAIERILETFEPKPSSSAPNPFQNLLGSLMGGSTSNMTYDKEEEEEEEETVKSKENQLKEKDELRKKIISGELDDIYIKIEVEENPSLNTISVFSQAGLEEMGVDFQNILGNIFPKKQTLKNLKIKDAKKVLQIEEASKLIDKEEVKNLAIKRVEQHGIIFIDEMDKIAGKEKGHGPDVSREGVQRDILPIVEGSTVITKYGPVKTDHILFIAAGAFNISKPSDLIPELQGRFPIRVELDSLNKDDFIRILKEPQNALTKQYKALMAADGAEIEFLDSGIEGIAMLAQRVNENTENIGARRLHTIMEKLLEDISFDLPEKITDRVLIDNNYVNEKLSNIVENQDLSRFIL